MRMHPLTQEIFYCLAIYFICATVAALVAWYGFGYLLQHAPIG